MVCPAAGVDTARIVEVGVGLDFGEAFVGNIGDRAVYGFTAVGDVVNTAARLQAEAIGARSRSLQQGGRPEEFA